MQQIVVIINKCQNLQLMSSQKINNLWVATDLVSLVNSDLCGLAPDWHLRHTAIYVFSYIINLLKTSSIRLTIAVFFLINFRALMSYMVLSRQNKAYFPWCCSLHMHHDFLYSGSRNIKHYTCIQELILMFSAWVGRSGATGLSRSDTSVFTVTEHINRNLIAEKYSSGGLFVFYLITMHVLTIVGLRKMQKKPNKQIQIVDNVKLWPVVQCFPLTVSF